MYNLAVMVWGFLGGALACRGFDYLVMKPLRDKDPKKSKEIRF